MDVLHDRSAALEIGKKDLKACVRRPSPTGRSRRQEIRTFATTTNTLLTLRDWLVAEQVTLVVMEATGDYWRGAYYLLEDVLNVILVNAAHAKGLPGLKTDVSDAAWLAQLGECGFLKASFVCLAPGEVLAARGRGGIGAVGLPGCGPHPRVRRSGCVVDHAVLEVDGERADAGRVAHRRVDHHPGLG